MANTHVGDGHSVYRLGSCAVPRLDRLCEVVRVMMTAVEKIRKSLQEVGIEIAYRWHLIWLARRTGKSIEW